VTCGDESMQNKMKVHGKMVASDAVEVLAGKRGAKTLPKKMLPVLEVIDNPTELPFLLEEINSLEPTDELRLALVRVQVHSEQNMHEDLNLHQKRLYAAQTMEKLIFGELCLEEGGDKKGKGKGKGKGKK
ncbi:MAG: hypothetical protein JSW28_06650, partial [Thermoplasmata archaeon]